MPVERPVYLNRALRAAGLLAVRPGPFGEMLETFESTALAVCDHQLAHVYVNDPAAVPRVRDVLDAVPGVARVLADAARGELGLDHPRAGELVVLAARDAWFAYPFWLDDRHAPDYARTVDIHRKPGFDPCELFFDPKLRWAKGRMLRRLVAKKLGFRTLFDRPLLIGDGPAPADDVLPMTSVRDLVLHALGL
jgi:hypothetical protein